MGMGMGLGGGRGGGLWEEVKVCSDVEWAFPEKKSLKLHISSPDFGENV